MASFDENGYAAPEEASSADIPPRFVTILGTRSDDDDATVWVLTNDQPPFEDYQVHRVRQHGRWHADSVFPFNEDTPEEIGKRARALG